MEIITREDRAKTVPERWAKQYNPRRDKPYWATQNDITDALLTMKRITADKVDALIGNDSWTWTHCSACGLRVDTVVDFGLRDDSEFPTIICISCIKSANDLINIKL